MVWGQKILIFSGYLIFLVIVRTRSICEATTQQHWPPSFILPEACAMAIPQDDQTCIIIIIIMVQLKALGILVFNIEF